MFHRLATAASNAMGSAWTFLFVIVSIAAWVALGPILDFSDRWQLVCNSFTTLFTYIAVVLLQHTQNRDTKALHAKLDELIRASAARNSFIEIEQASEEKLAELKKSLQAP